MFLPPKKPRQISVWKEAERIAGTAGGLLKSANYVAYRFQPFSLLAILYFMSPLVNQYLTQPLQPIDLKY